MTGYLGKTTNQDRDVVGAVAQSERESVWGEMPGRVVSVSADGRTVTVQPLYKPKFNGVPTDMPVLQEVPLRQALMGGVGVTVPVKPGQNVTLRPQMRSMDNYHVDGDGSASDSRSFSLSDMEAHIAGGESLKDVIPNLDSENVHVRANADGSKGMKLSPEGKVEFQGPEGNLLDLIADFMELVANDKLQINYGSSAGTNHAMANKAAMLALAAKVRTTGTI